MQNLSAGFVCTAVFQQYFSNFFNLGIILLL